MARPIPELAPVTSARLPVNWISIRISSPRVRAWYGPLRLGRSRDRDGAGRSAHAPSHAPGGMRGAAWGPRLSAPANPSLDGKRMPAPHLRYPAQRFGNPAPAGLRAERGPRGRPHIGLGGGIERPHRPDGGMSRHGERPGFPLGHAERPRPERRLPRRDPGRVVYDLGAGVGPMSYYALRAGARRVYGFEVDPDVLPYLRRLARAYSNFVPVWTDALAGRLPEERPDVLVCEMWSTWLTDWPMVRVLRRVLRRAPGARVIPARGYHVVQLVQARHRAGMPIRLTPGTEATVFGEPFATGDMSLPVVACVTDFRGRIRPVDTVVALAPLTAGTVNAVRLYSYEEVSPGHVLPRIGTRCDELLRWLPPLRVHPGRRVRLRIRHRWDAGLRITVV